MSDHPKVLVSHSGRDSAVAQRVSDALRTMGVTPLDPLNFSAGVTVRKAVLRASKVADALIVIVATGDERLPAWAEYEVGLFDAQNKLIIVLASDRIPADSMPVELKGNRWHSFDPAKPEQAARWLANELLAAA
jgi:ApbE superfamily uncharacterized protein (UPF0280 family)